MGLEISKVEPQMRQIVGKCINAGQTLYFEVWSLFVIWSCGARLDAIFEEDFTTIAGVINPYIILVLDIDYTCVITPSICEVRLEIGNFLLWF